ncbi:paraflagellar rod component par4, putative [Trypanosoma equiperdum]|uniref:Paraflagellar rod component Par4, putative n=5 Tax=Trypanozoon TaxID=39700 RepID=Q57Z01_TRYB2|nr:paraflagellar rod component par4, putative [Trypanosoma brucei gambiense DAL972]XP_845118.1 paraflagellar rod component Par4, putative [Trypanosoma brucei brucei TREU927]AAX70764.1 paraflagellar rod component Par4, putative [Trypanosoma brucei]RHW72653.1 paraflagellar rod component par4 [Trypanosoma brucei equiperdum]SCU70505.1 paraflagellar rod component par4, putative [Trypanosoma equiperdum]AAX80598.1 paraflagellar rod component Par4, putative [Trypanosoma brucei]AAZ11559.1 paraflagella|eukprot:XP_011773749.1 paraflagellar rod component par4, putative [Trypanosoma brucei gambiense DAL972]
MAPKRGRKKGNKEVSAEILRMQQLRAQEAEGEEIQKRENERRDREEQEERITLWKEEQVRILREKEGKVKELMAKVEQLTATLREERMASEVQVEQLVLMRDTLLNEVGLLRLEVEEKQKLLVQEKHTAELQLNNLRAETEKTISSIECDNENLRVELRVAKEDHSEYRIKMEARMDEKEGEIRSHALTIAGLQRELEKAISMNRSMQEVVETREADDRKNVALMQMLNAQIEENKRRYEEQLEEEQRQASIEREKYLQLEAKCSRFEDEVEALKKENTDIKMNSDVVLRDYKQQLEQVKHDSQYLSGELQTIHEKRAVENEEMQNEREKLEKELEATFVELESNQRRMEELEHLLRRKERENFDKITFLNAQIANNRTATSQLQQKLLSERRAYEIEISRTTEEAKEKERELDTARQLVAQSKDGAKEREAKLLSDIAVLKSQHLQLQATLQGSQNTLDTAVAAKDGEIARLRRLLDAHFIPHRNTIEGEVETHEGTIAILSEKISELTREMEVREQLALETETQLKARIFNQEEVIDALREDLRVCESRRREELRSSEDEVSRLKKTLEVHFIPYEM